MGIQLTSKIYVLKFKHPFGVSSNTRIETTTIFVRLQHNGCEGFGEACLPSYLGESVEETMFFFEKIKHILKNFITEFEIAEVLQQVDKVGQGNNAAKAAIDIALHDLKAKIKGRTFREMMGLNSLRPVASSFTIGIDTEEIVAKKITEANEFSIFKIKAGTKNDKALIEMIRKYSHKPLYVDVNQGWTSKEYVLEMIEWMAKQNVLLVEQPMPISMKAEMKWVTERSPLATIADESVKRLKDLTELDGVFDGVNIKLMKSTGIAEALKMIDFCQKNNLKIFLGCMAESSCATSAMAQLMDFADYVDLDAPLLYKNDPFLGLNYIDGKIALNDLPGLGTQPFKDLFN